MIFIGARLQNHACISFPFFQANARLIVDGTEQTGTDLTNGLICGTEVNERGAASVMTQPPYGR